MRFSRNLPLSALERPPARPSAQPAHVHRWSTARRPPPALRLALSLAVGLSLLACDKSGVHDLGRRSDTLSTCDSATSSWVRSLEGSTELFVLGTRRAGLGAANGCYVRTLVFEDSTIEMETGTFVLDAAGAGAASVSASYDFPFQPELSPLQRRGVRREDYDEPLVRSLTAARDGEQLLLAVDGDERRLTPLPEIIRRLDTSTQAGAEDIFRLVNIMFYMTQVRVEGFGASGMTQYTAPSTFVGIVGGTYRVAVTPQRLRILVDLTYTGVRDLTDIQLDGNQHTNVALSGSGTTSDVLIYTLDHPDRSTPIEFAVHYDEATIVNGMAASGYYPCDVDGRRFDIDYPLQNDVHLRNLLPVGE